jgi:hypothetical protein
MQIELITDNWFTGGFYLNTCAVYLPSDKDKMPIGVDRNQLDKKELNSINAIQKELFEIEVTKKVQFWQKIFSENYQRSKLREKYLSDEILDFHFILLGEADRNYHIEAYELEQDNLVSIHLNNSVLDFPRNDLLKIRKYIFHHQKKGLTKTFNFIHSPNFEYAICKNKELPQVYAEAAWNYFEFLNNFKSNSEKTSQIKSNFIINELALIHAYNQVPITRKNCDKIAQENGFTSGQKLYQRYTWYTSPANRKGKPHPFSIKKLENKVGLIKAVLEYLKEEAKKRASDEITILENFYENE